MSLRVFQIFSAVACMHAVGIAGASLSPRLGGQAVYDSDQNITWLADAGGAGSTRPAMIWLDAVEWAAAYSLGGASEWRLPTTSNPDASCDEAATSSGFHCTGSEMGYLFYVQLGGTAGQPILSSTDPDVALFSNLDGANWWSGTSFTISEFAWDFRFASGNQGASNKANFEYFAWAVHDGDVFGLDTDGDGVADAMDNCTEVANADQRDTDGDGFGNACDADLNNDCIVNVLDLGEFKNFFFSVEPNADFNGDGVVNVLDLGGLRVLYFLEPGPSGIVTNCE